MLHCSFQVYSKYLKAWTYSYARREIAKAEGKPPGSSNPWFTADACAFWYGSVPCNAAVSVAVKHDKLSELIFLNYYYFESKPDALFCHYAWLPILRLWIAKLWWTGDVPHIHPVWTLTLTRTESYPERSCVPGPPSYVQSHLEYIGGQTFYRECSLWKRSFKTVVLFLSQRGNTTHLMSKFDAQMFLG